MNSGYAEFENPAALEENLESQNLNGLMAELDDYNDSPSKDPNIIMIATVVVGWVTIIISILIAFFIAAPKSKKSTAWWEFLTFAHLYYNLGALIAMYLPQNIEEVKDLAWFGNGGLGGAVSLVIATILCAIYAKIIKVRYGSDLKSGTWCAARVIYLGIVMLAGFAAGGVIIYEATSASKARGEKWMFAVGMIVAIYAFLALPVVCIAVYALGANSYPVEEKKPTKSQDSTANSKMPTPVSKQGGHIRSIAIGGQKTESKIVMKRTASQQSTGSGYYQQLMQDGNAPQVKSISQYGAMGAGGGPKAPTGTSPPPTPPPSPVKKTSSQQSTGSGYYQQLMQGGNAPKVKSISQYGALLQGSPK